MKKIDEHKLDRIKELLNEQENWPIVYQFKFIVPVAKLNEIISLFPGDEEHMNTKASSKGNYISVTIKKQIFHAEEVVEVYRRASVVDGIYSL